MIKSQFHTLEEPMNAIAVNINHTPEKICQVIINKMSNKGFRLT